MTEAPKKKSMTATWIVIVIIAGCPVMLGLCGVLAAIAIPAFIGYMQRSKTAEATTNVSAIFASARLHADEHGDVPAIARTPMDVPCGARVVWPIDADPAWDDMGFAPLDPVYYSYEIVRSGDDVIIRATGDLDCDGIYSSYELRARLESGALIREPEIVETDPLE